MNRNTLMEGELPLNPVYKVPSRGSAYKWFSTLVRTLAIPYAPARDNGHEEVPVLWTFW